MGCPRSSGQSLRLDFSVLKGAENLGSRRTAMPLRLPSYQSWERDARGRDSNENGLRGLFSQTPVSQYWGEGETGLRDDPGASERDLELGVGIGS